MNTFGILTCAAGLNCVLIFRVSTQHRQYLLQAVGKDPVRELYEWLYAMNPLLAGQIR